MGQHLGGRQTDPHRAGPGYVLDQRRNVLVLMTACFLRYLDLNTRVAFGAGRRMVSSNPGGEHLDTPVNNPSDLRQHDEIAISHPQAIESTSPRRRPHFETSLRCRAAVSLQRRPVTVQIRSSLRVRNRAGRTTIVCSLSNPQHLWNSRTFKPATSSHSSASPPTRERTHLEYKKARTMTAKSRSTKASKIPFELVASRQRSG